MYGEDLKIIVSEAYERLVLGDSTITVSLLLSGLHLNASLHVDSARSAVNEALKAELTTI